MARIAHNHWVLQRLVSAAQAHSSSSARLRGWAEDVVGSYTNSSADDNWRAAVNEAWRIAEATSAQLKDAKPGGELVA
jgi:predicted Zn-dependent protease